MKMTLAFLLTLGSLASFAQDGSPDLSTSDAMKRLAKAHTNSKMVQDIKMEVEREHGVECKGGTSMILPAITKRVKYSATCTGNKTFKLEIVSQYSYFVSCFSPSPYSFKLKEIKQKF
jgi:hypothetical protein